MGVLVPQSEDDDLGSGVCFVQEGRPHEIGEAIAQRYRGL